MPGLGRRAPALLTARPGEPAQASPSSCERIGYRLLKRSRRDFLRVASGHSSIPGWPLSVTVGASKRKGIPSATVTIHEPPVRVEPVPRRARQGRLVRKSSAPKNSRNALGMEAGMTPMSAHVSYWCPNSAERLDPWGVEDSHFVGTLARPASAGSETSASATASIKPTAFIVFLQNSEAPLTNRGVCTKFRVVCPSGVFLPN